MANHGPTNMANHGPTNMANHGRLLWPNKNSAPKCNQENGIRIFDPMLFEDTDLSKLMEDFNTKCYVMNNEEKSVETLFLLMKKTRGKNVLLFTKFVLGGFCPGDFCRGGGAYVRGFLSCHRD